MDRRPLVALLVLGLAASPAPALGASLDELLAGAQASGTLSEDPALTAQTSNGTLSETPTAATGGSAGTGTEPGGGGESPSPADKPTASADVLPFTGSDPRITLLLGVAALLAGAGLRLRTGDARDF